MAIRIAINGFGRIGRLVTRTMLDDPTFEIVAINDLTGSEDLAYLLKYDTTQGRFKEDSISFDEEGIIVDGKKIKVLNEKDPALLPWADLNVDLVFECTGVFNKKEKASTHITAGAKKVLISAPAGSDLKTIVYNVNHDTLDGSEEVISAASCTTNCLAPVLKVIDDEFGIEKGFMTTVHAYTNDQVTLDIAHKKGIKSRRGRAAAQNIIPTSTGAASAVGLVIPSLQGRLDGTSLRIPIPAGSVIDLVLELKRNTTVEEINNTFKNNVNETIKYTEDPVVSSDIIGTYCGALVDGLCTSIVEADGKQLIKIVAWYDNEMGYSAQMVRTAKHLVELIK
ncbi:MAG: type I glyceraldehyde-3-phosphate dehydrogenase [Bacilli bacterium]|nr:type I glyceraldehyde-3-phosphate dehydrogenase [Bacilli bacterium]MDD3304576.1 type I glyceraldehyde-3-phosphate dehydrogenase [Bacilli bacterium]MDD4054100.1 type I glyceraldehyde-3-phosphate dehydrogenase [Bacilli bacterium]MDD4411881.1 type I glyceraldehyde-3-phosphate dehydrogenase [Bacilli bacterium]